MKYELRTSNANGEQFVMEGNLISTLLSPHSIKFSPRATRLATLLPFSTMRNINIVINNIQEYRKMQRKLTYSPPNTIIRLSIPRNTQ